MHLPELRFSYTHSQKEKHRTSQKNTSLHKFAAKYGKDLLKKLQLRWQEQPHYTQPEIHLGKYRLQQLLRKEYGKGQASSETSLSHSSSLSANSASGILCVRADIFAFKKMDVALKGKKGNPLFKISFIVFRAWNCWALERLAEVFIYEPKFVLMQTSVYK